MAADLVRDFPEAQIKAQIEQVDWLRERQPKKVKDLGAYLTKAVREDFAPPAGFEGRAACAARETAGARRSSGRPRPGRRRPAREAEAQIQAYRAALTPDERERLDAEALARADPAARAGYETATSPQVRRMHLTVLREALVRHRLGLPATD